MKKEEFVTEFKNTIIEWSKIHETDLLDYRSYRWKGKTYEESVKLRNALEEAITASREKNEGGVDLETVDKVYDWGFGKSFPLRDQEKILEETREAFQFLDENDCYQACRRLMQIEGVGVAGATKVLGLSNQEKFCIYDSRVGLALSDLKKDGKKIIRCPPGRRTKGDYVSYEKWNDEWSLDYQKLIWTLEIVRDYLKTKALNLRISDIEMALFMRGTHQSHF
ncbi:MAG: hypothetical protein QXE76_01125 [Candidatus Bathyarchaeia archaeon]